KESLLAKIPGVEEVVKLDEPYSWLLSTTKADDIRASIFTFCAEHKLTVITLKQKSMQMEEVFQALTKE
ncbi:MAG TPA: hypothetical protein DG754_04975, partial [Bacteroidales bacterium]|nr:hypothetical protein [Bacteroidales bacterium]